MDSELARWLLKRIALVEKFIAVALAFPAIMYLLGVDDLLVGKLSDINTWRALFRNYPLVVDKILSKWYVLLLIMSTIHWYLQYAKAVKNEIHLMDGLFVDEIRPTENEFVSKKIIQILPYAFIASFLFLLGSVNYLKTYCVAALLLTVCDVIGSSHVIANFRKFFMRSYVDRNSSNIYDLDQLAIDNPRINFVKQKREVLARYYIENPVFGRIFIRMLFFFLPFFVLDLPTIYPSIFCSRPDSTGCLSAQALEPASYTIVVLNIIVTEWWIRKWRGRRDRSLDVIKARERSFIINERKRLMEKKREKDRQGKNK